RDVVLWALKNGEVTSDTIEVEISMLPYAAIIEAFGSQSYDVVEASPVAVPRALQGDLELLLFSPGLVNRAGTSLYVGAGSDLTDPRDLRGQTIGVFSLGGTFVLETRYVLHKGYGLDVSLTGGDVTFQEVPPQNLLQMLKDGSLPAGVVLQQAGYLIRDSADYRRLVDVTGEFQRLTGQYSMNSILVTYPDTAGEKGEALRELARLLQASAQYAEEHRGEVIAAVAEARGEDAGYLEYFFEAYDLVFGDPVTDYADAITVTWEAAREIGDTRSVPSVDDLLFR
ncbi:MAG TPA: MqnA/MqnD/SBP family protein, partial [Bacillota bacterium]